MQNAYVQLKWHKNNHSGEVMSRIEKASSALRNFVDGGFQYIETVVRFFASAIALCFLSLASGEVALALGLFCFFIIFRFDKRLIAYNKEMNEDWHKYDGTFYDSTIHRLHLLPEFDMIYLFEEGEVVAEGNFNHLLKSHEPFRKMWKIYQKALKH